MRDQHHGENNDEQMVREPEVGEGVEGGTQSRSAEASGAFGPARGEGVSDHDEQDQEPSRDKSSRRRDISQRKRFRGAEPDLFVARSLRPDQGRGRDENAVKRACNRADDGEPDMVLDGVVEVEVAA